MKEGHSFYAMPFKKSIPIPFSAFHGSKALHDLLFSPSRSARLIRAMQHFSSLQHYFVMQISHAAGGSLFAFDQIDLSLADWFR